MPPLSSGGENRVLALRVAAWARCVHTAIRAAAPFPEQAHSTHATGRCSFPPSGFSPSSFSELAAGSWHLHLHCGASINLLRRRLATPPVPVSGPPIA